MGTGFWYKVRVLVWGEIPASLQEKRLVQKLDTVILVSRLERAKHYMEVLMSSLSDMVLSSVSKHCFGGD